MRPNMYMIGIIHIYIQFMGCRSNKNQLQIRLLDKTAQVGDTVSRKLSCASLAYSGIRQLAGIVIRVIALGTRMRMTLGSTSG